MSWAEVSKINSDLTVPLNELIKNRVSGFTSNGAVFTSDGTFTVPEGIRHIWVDAIGAGGTGGDGGLNGGGGKGASGGDGGDGYYVLNELLEVTPLSTIDIVVGNGASKIGNLLTVSAGGSGGSVPTTGTSATVFNGGNGGIGGNGGNGGKGASLTNNVESCKGGNGGNGVSLGGIGGDGGDGGNGHNADGGRGGNGHYVGGVGGKSNTGVSADDGISTSPKTIQQQAFFSGLSQLVFGKYGRGGKGGGGSENNTLPVPAYSKGKQGTPGLVIIRW